jgi:FMN phosphatase YigB (HAD superfamily)
LSSIICIDLDHTLLIRQEEKYQRAVIEGLCNNFRYEDSEDCLKRLYQAIHSLTKKNSPDQTLYDSFLENFLHNIEVETSDARAAFDAFYRDSYPKLSHLTRPNPGASEFIGHALRDGYKLVIATNPIYPLSAIHERLKWAGLSDYIDRFSLITSIENLHFAKPTPEYYCEILAKLGWPEEETVVMVGDSLELDIRPAIKAGMYAFWLNQGDIPEELRDVCSSGSFEDLSDWLHALEDRPGDYQKKSRNQDLFAKMRASAATIHSVREEYSDEIWRFKPAENEWSLIEIICHLRDADRFVNIPRFKEAFAEENPFLASIDTDSWVTECNYIDEPVDSAVQQMLNARMQFIDLLKNFPGEWWKKPARHSVFGPTCLAELVMFIITHDKIHIRQIQKTLEEALSSVPSTNSR